MIYKYTILSPEDKALVVTTELDLPNNSTFLSVVGDWDGNIQAYFDVGKETKERELWIFKSVLTGQEMPNDLAFADTIIFGMREQHPNYGMVYHVFYILEH